MTCSLDRLGLPAEDIIFDPNIFAVATGIEAHAEYGVAFIEAARQIKERMPAVTGVRRVEQPVVLVPRQQPAARGNAQRVSLPRGAGRDWEWRS